MLKQWLKEWYMLWIPQSCTAKPILILLLVDLWPLLIAECVLSSFLYKQCVLAPAASHSHCNWLSAGSSFFQGSTYKVHLALLSTLQRASAFSLLWWAPCLYNLCQKKFSRNMSFKIYFVMSTDHSSWELMPLSAFFLSCWPSNKASVSELVWWPRTVFIAMFRSLAILGVMKMQLMRLHQ